MTLRAIFIAMSLLLLLPALAEVRAQHCGFDFSSIIIIKLEQTGLTQVKMIEAVLPDGKAYRFWKNELPKDGQLPKIIHRPSKLDSHSYWFADSNYVIAGPLGHERVIPIIVSYTTERAPDTLHVTPDYIHSLCSNFGSWAYLRRDETLARFKPIVLDIHRIASVDTIGQPANSLITDRTEYRSDDTIKIARKPGWYIRNDELKTDGACHAKIVYGVKQRIGNGWDELWPVQQIQHACGPGYTFGFGEMRIRVTPDLKPGVYRVFFENSDREILETSDLEIID